ncbi:response regulator transcription factor [Acinetobacter sp. ANC 3791]|nr:helix-turn-helix transcriptional regulator [Acinetobacter sp. ANC 3791]
MNNIKVLSPIRDFHLTRREHEVFNLLKQDYSYYDISERLHISLNTIKTHTSSIYSKLNIKSRMDLKNFHDSN